MSTPSKPYKPGFIANKGREAKAKKIKLILDEAKGQTPITTSGQRLLDVGTGNGEIASYLSEIYDVMSVDVLDQRLQKEEYKFIQTKSEKLPFSNNSFDFVVSNHVIEHVPDANLHLTEIFRILKPGGLVYLATPNRFWPYEVHNKVYMLHYLPWRTFNLILKKIGWHHENIHLLSWTDLKQRTSWLFEVKTVSDKICQKPLKYHMKCRPIIAGLLSMIPLKIYTLLTFIHPTLIVVLQKK